MKIQIYNYGLSYIVIFWEKKRLMCNFDSALGVMYGLDCFTVCIGDRDIEYLADIVYGVQIIFWF
jgi:hypothetical protein